MKQSLLGAAFRRKPPGAKKEEELCSTSTTTIWYQCFETVIRTNRARKVQKMVKPGEVLKVLRDVSNEKDPNAVKLTTTKRDGDRGDQGGEIEVGFIPSAAAQHLSKALGEGEWEARAIILNTDCAVVPIKIEFTMPCGAGVTCPSTPQKRKLDSVLNEARDGQKKQFKEKCTQLARNFDQVIHHSIESYAHLFCPKELALIQSIKDLPLASKTLFVRLFMRKAQWFRISLLSYAEIEDIKGAVEQLRRSGLLAHLSDMQETPPLEDQLTMLTATELQQLAAKHIPGTKKQHHKRMKVQDLKRSLCKLQDNQEDLDLDVDVQSLLRESVTLDEDARRVLSHVQFAYFLNEEQGLERFILRETGLLNYPQYNVRISRQIFSTRVELMQYQEALRLDFELQTAMEKNDSVRMRQIICQSCLKLGYVLEEEEWTKSSTQKMCHLTKAYFCKHSNNSDASASTSSITTPSWQQCFCASWVHVTIARQGISLLEKHKRYADAIELIQVLLGRPEQPSKRGDWWNRFAIDLEHMGKVETSLEIAETALADKWVRVGHRLSLQRRVLRLGRPPRRWKKPAFAERASWSPRERKVVGRPTNRMKSVKSNFVGFDDADISVEHLAIQYYSRDEFGSWNGLHCENGIWNTLFALVMWDILFSDLPDVFQHPFQTGPLDLDTDYFYSMRKDSIDARLKEISNGMGPQLVEKIYAKHSEAKMLCSGLSWDKYSLEQLLEITKCVGGPGLAVIVRLLARDHKHWRSGMPDLILWRTEPSQASKLVEVKGPRDTLADHQRAWLAELSFGGLDVEICRVYEP